MTTAADTKTPQNIQKYGVPLYGAAWTHVKNYHKTESSSSSPDNNNEYLVLAGGGGEGRSGIPNAILVSQFDTASLSLSSQPVARLGTGNELPYRMAVHPKGEGVICSLPNSCRWYEWDVTDSNEDGKLSLKSSDKVLDKLEDVGQQLAIAFSDDGSLLAVGSEDGRLRVFKWPSLEIVLNEEGAYTSVKDLHFSADGKNLVSVGSGGPCRVWDVKASKIVASLPKKNDEMFGFCRFSHRDGDPVLYTTAMQSKGGSIITWNVDSWKRTSTKQIVPDPISAFNVSVDGKFIAIGTIQGDVTIVDATKMRVQMTVKKAHLGLVTALSFSSDSRALGSASMDSSVRVTLVEDKPANGFNYWIIVFVLLLAMILYYLKTNGMIPENLLFHKLGKQVD